MRLRAAVVHLTPDQIACSNRAKDWVVIFLFF